MLETASLRRLAACFLHIFSEYFGVTAKQRRIHHPMAKFFALNSNE
jgi:hypothetical protein